MRTKKIEGTPRVVLNMEEAYKLKDALDGFIDMTGEKYGYTPEVEEFQKLYETLDETILKAEAIY